MKSKKIKKFIASLMTVAIVLCSSPIYEVVGLKLPNWLHFGILSSVASAETVKGSIGDNFTWAFDEETGELRIEGNGNLDSYTIEIFDRYTPPWNCYNNLINSVIIGDGITNIYSTIFDEMISLTSITIPESLTGIPVDTFKMCGDVKKYNVNINNEYYSSDDDGNLYNKDKTKLIRHPANYDRTYYVIPNSVTSIASFAFANCRSLTNITIPDSVTSIEENAFINCTSLTSIEIPDSVTSIGYSVFFNCTSLTSIEIPHSVTSIDESVFSNCTSLRSVEIPDSVTSIGNGLFIDCISLRSIEIPDSVTSIEISAFKNCSNLTKIIIPKSVVSIGDNAFEGCDGITIYCYLGSFAESYANSHNISIKYIENVKSVSVNDFVMNYKSSSKVNPTINADEGAMYTVSYSSSNTMVATVDNGGNVYATGKGTAMITCTVTDSNGNVVTNTCNVTVKYTLLQWIIRILLLGFLWY